MYEYKLKVIFKSTSHTSPIYTNPKQLLTFASAILAVIEVVSEDGFILTSPLLICVPSSSSETVTCIFSPFVEIQTGLIMCL